MYRHVLSMHAFFLAILGFYALEVRGDISIHTDFDGSSAKIVSIDQKAHVICFKPGGDAARGQPCRWCFRAEGLPVGEDTMFEVITSEQPRLTDDIRKGKRIGLAVTGLDSAFMSADGTMWTQTPVGEKKPDGATPTEVLTYRIKASACTLWLAWGPPILPKDTAALAEKNAGIRKPIELARTREGHSVTALHSKPAKADAPAIEITLDLRGTPFVIDVKSQKLTSGKTGMPMPIREGRLDLRVICDHNLIEVFTDYGFKFGAFPHMPNAEARLAPKLTASGGEAKIVLLDVHELKSVWPTSKKN